jgi:chromodomain-helicase-DNA-binding protein 1
MYRKILKNQADEALAKKGGGIPTATGTNGSSGPSTAVAKN